MLAIVLFKRKENCKSPSNINKDYVYVEIKACGLTEATFSDIALPDSESFINRGAKLPS